MKEYLEFIESCRNKVYDCPTQKHHIIPISIGGARNSTNTIYLSYEDHWRAHVMLAEVFPNNRRLSAVGHVTLEDFISRAESQSRNSFGRKDYYVRDEQHRKKISDALIEKYKNPVYKEIMRKSHQGQTREGKKIRCIETGVVYNSLKEASEILGISVPVISLNLTGKRPSAGKLHFEYV